MGLFYGPVRGDTGVVKMKNAEVVIAERLIEQARKDLARKRMAALRRQRERLLFTLERRATLIVKEMIHV